MSTITLKNDLSDSFTLIRYPDGQKSLKLNLSTLNIKEPIIIRCRIRYFSELEVLLILVRALEANDFIIDEINYIYLFGLRSDRAFSVGEPNYLKGLKSILHAIYPRYKIFFPHNVHYFRFNCNEQAYAVSMHLSKYLNLVGGDESTANNLNLVQYHFKKERKDGTISVSLKDEFIEHLKQNDEPIVICDDLCDGGATFIAEAEYLKPLFPNRKLILFVVHGLFTQGLQPLLNCFDEIICTNSYQDIEHEKVNQIKVI